MDVTPDGQPIDTFTMWLDFGDEGECAVSLDLTRLNAALTQLRETSERRKQRKGLL
jgi:hypothetical protein